MSDSCARSVPPTSTSISVRPGGTRPRRFPPLVVVIDEFASLARDVPDFLSALVDIAQRGSLGVHLLLATQRPAGVVSDDIRANTNMRIALRLHDRADAVDVIGDAAAAGLPRGVPGRALLRLGPSELVMFQVASCCGPLPKRQRGLVVETTGTTEATEATEATGTTEATEATEAGAAPAARSGGTGRRHSAGPAGTHRSGRPTRPSELAVAVEAIQAAHRARGGASPHRPWVDPLPAMLPPTTLERRLQDEHRPPGSTHRDCGGAPTRRDVIGLVDEPDHQAVAPLTWERAAGNLASAG